MRKYSIISDMHKIKPRLLVVDDEPDQCDSIKNYFSRRNFVVQTASNGEDAISLIKETNPDLVLLDLKLTPDMNGKEVLRRLRLTDKGTKVVVITGDFLNDDELKEITSYGIADFLNKPLNISTLEDLIKKVLNDKYPKNIQVEQVKAPKGASKDVSLRRVKHDLANVTNDISNKCELYVLNAEDGIYNDKTAEERLNMANEVIKSVLKSVDRLAELTNKLSSFVVKKK